MIEMPLLDSLDKS